jgi:NADP-dependent 3-hydroxy acid dehydrogenase YdfG
MTGERLDGTVALVTGASSGIGEATARVLSEAGAAVAIAARRVDRLAELASSIEEKGGRALVIETDVTDKKQARELVDRTVAELGRLDTVVNNASVMLLGPAETAPTRSERTPRSVSRTSSCSRPRTSPTLSPTSSPARGGSPSTRS